MLRYRMLLFKASRLAAKNKLSNVEEISLAGQFAELLESQEDADRLIEDLVDHENPHMRRIGLHAIRRARRFGGQALLPALLRRLVDPEAWLRHDAVWIVQEAKLDGGELRASLRRVAGNTRLPQDAIRARDNPGDGALQAAVRARQVLDVLIQKSAAEHNAALAAGGGLAGATDGKPYAQDSIGHIRAVHRQLQKRMAKRKLSSSTKLKFRKVESQYPPNDNRRFLL
ncbi:HEAT repeat domain-containing protein [Cupriavidus sp. H19C3]